MVTNFIRLFLRQQKINLAHHVSPGRNLSRAMFSLATLARKICASGNPERAGIIEAPVDEILLACVSCAHLAHAQPEHGGHHAAAGISDFGLGGALD